LDFYQTGLFPSDIFTHNSSKNFSTNIFQIKKKKKKISRKIFSQNANIKSKLKTTC